MRALVVYESMFGNTKAIALAIAEGIRQFREVDSYEVGEAPAVLPSDVDLLVVGGPTHAHGMTNPRTRTTAAERAGIRLVSRGPGIREWLDSLVPAPTDVVAAAFDTRIKGPELITGSAAKGATKRLRVRGLRTLEPASFIVAGPTGEPFDRMSEAELARARAWGATLAAAVERAGLAVAR
jgi:hypothetical protein